MINILKSMRSCEVKYLYEHLVISEPMIYIISFDKFWPWINGVYLIYIFMSNDFLNSTRHVLKIMFLYKSEKSWFDMLISLINMSSWTSHFIWDDSNKFWISYYDFDVIYFYQLWSCNIVSLMEEYELTWFGYKWIDKGITWVFPEDIQTIWRE